MTRTRPARGAALAGVLLLPLALGACGAEPPDVGVPPADAALAEPEPLAGWATQALDAYLGWSAWRESRSGFIAMFARDHAGYGITYHADAYIEQVFSRWFNVDRSATAKIGKQEVLSLTPLAEVGPEKPYVRPMDARKPGVLRRLERKLRV